MPKYLAVYDREDGWKLHGQVPYQTREVSVPSRRHKYGFKFEKQSYQPNRVVPKPEDVSPFIAAHRIIEAENMEEACRLMSAFPKP